MSLIASTAESPRPCDADRLLQSLAGNRQVARKLVQMFLDMYPDRIALIDAAVQGADWVALRRVVHDLRGSCAVFSATACLALAGKLENALPDRVDQKLIEDCARFKEALADVAEELRLFLNDPPESSR